MQPSTTPAKRPPPRKLTLQQRIVLQGLATRCQPDQTFRQCVEEIAGWLGIRSTRTETILESGLRKLSGDDDSGDCRRTYELFLSQLAAHPQLARKFTVDGMSFEDKLRGLRLETRRHLVVLGHLPAAPTTFLDGVQRVAQATERSADLIRETLALGLAIFFPDLHTTDDRASAFYAVAQEKLRGAPEPRTSPRENSPEPCDARRPVDARALQRRYDVMSDRDKARTHDLAMWTRLGGAMPVSRAEAHRLYRLLFPGMRNASQQENSLRLALKRKRLVLKDKRHQVAFLTTADRDV